MFWWKYRAVIIIMAVTQYFSNVRMIDYCFLSVMHKSKPSDIELCISAMYLYFLFKIQKIYHLSKVF